MTTGTLEFGTLRFGSPDQDWPLNKGFGDRSIHVRVVAPSAHPDAAIALSISGIDAEHHANVRVRLTATCQDADGFTIRIQTWWDTRLWGLAVSWVRR